MRKRAMLTVLTALAMVVTACGGGVPEAAAPNDTIAVHGDWTIDIYNPDGTLDEHVEFENAFSGNLVLSTLLAGGYEVDTWSVALGGADSPCAVTGVPDPVECVITEDPDWLQENISNDLVVTADAGTVVLSGSTVAGRDGTVDFVDSGFGLASTTGGAPYGSVVFTSTDYPDVAVAEGQTIQVEVVISFTTG